MRLLAAIAVLLGCAAVLPAQDQPGPLQPYALRPGDIVEITVWGREDYSGEFQVDELGLIRYPVLGGIDTRGMTIAALRDTLQAGLERLFVNPFVTITPKFRIAVLGEVRSPGLYAVDPTLSVLDVVALAGGSTAVGNLDKIRLFRSGTESRVSFAQETIRARTLRDIGIRSGDEIIVPRRFFTRQDFSILLALAQIALSIVILANTI